MSSSEHFIAIKGRDGTETSRDAILSQSSLTGSVIYYRENNQNIVIPLLMLYRVNEIDNV